jgi:hypothetical protein
MTAERWGHRGTALVVVVWLLRLKHREHDAHERIRLRLQRERLLGDDLEL